MPCSYFGLNYQNFIIVIYRATLVLRKINIQLYYRDKLSTIFHWQIDLKNQKEFVRGKQYNCFAQWSLLTIVFLQLNNTYLKLKLKNDKEDSNILNVKKDIESKHSQIKLDN